MMQSEYIKEESIPINWERIKKLLILTAIMMIDQFLRTDFFLISVLGINRYNFY